MRKDAEKIENYGFFLQKQVQKIPFYVKIEMVLGHRKKKRQGIKR